MQESDQFYKLQELLEENQFELIFPEDYPEKTKGSALFTEPFTEGTEKREYEKIYLVYLMNDAVESFLTFQNVKITGTYKVNYEGELEFSLSKEGDEYVLAVHQGDTVVTLFFHDLSLEVNLYDYSEIGHFWVEGYEYLRQLEYKIAIVHDKYEYLGELYCTKMEKEIAALADFPPLNYCCYPAVPSKYIVPKGNPWVPSAKAIEVMIHFSEMSGDRSLVRVLKRYRKIPVPFLAKIIATMLRQNKHARTVDLLAQELFSAAQQYPKRVFHDEAGQQHLKKMEEAKKKQLELKQAGIASVILREEPFTISKDSIEFHVYLMIWKKGILNRKVVIEEIE